MAKEMLLRMTCDFCGTKLTVPVDQPTNELNGWIIVATSDKNGQPVQKYYCGKSCAMNGIKFDGEPAIASGFDSSIKNIGSA